MRRFLPVLLVIVGVVCPAAAVFAQAQPTATTEQPPPTETEKPAPEPAADAAKTDDPAGEKAAPADAAPTPTAAPATPPRPAVMHRTLAMETSGLSVDSPRSKANNWLVMPRGGYELGASLSFMTSETLFAPLAQLSMGAPLRFTDVVFLGLHGRRSLMGKADLFAGIDILAKQPSYLDEPVISGLHLGNRTALARKYAIWSRVAAGPMLRSDPNAVPGEPEPDPGYWGTLDIGLQGKKKSHETISFEGTIGGSAAVLLPGEDGSDALFFGEVVVRGETLFHAPRGEFGVWLGTEFRFPVANSHGADNPDMNGFYLDPRTRVNVHIGAVVSVIEHLDIYAQLAIIDRGDASAPETNLPVLAGGFDQHHLVFGIIRRFTSKKKRRHPYQYR